VFEKCRRLAYTIFRGARGIFDRLIWILRHHAFFWDKAIPFAAGAVAAQLASYSLFKIDVPSTVKYISLSVALLGFLSLYIHHFSLKPNGRIKDLSVKVREGEFIFENVGQSMLTNPTVNRRLENGANNIHYDKKLGKIDPLVDHFLVYFILNLKNGPNAAKLDTFDEKKLGLKTDISIDLLDRGGDVDVQRTSYFRDRLSNGLINWRVEIKNRVAFDFVEETFDLIRASDGNYSWRLKDLANSNLANQLGASALLITANGYVVYLTQGSRSAENSDRLAPSGSGSFDSDSIGRLPNATLQALVHAEMRRELCEECGLADADIHDVQICGYGRYLYRGGKPEFFCIATTQKSYSDISVPLRELDWQQSQKAGKFLDGVQRNGQRALANSIADALETHGSDMEQNHHVKPVSGPLLWNIRIAADYLRHADDKALSRLLSPLLSNSSTERST
jgi:hypothetical protein